MDALQLIKQEIHYMEKRGIPPRSAERAAAPLITDLLDKFQDGGQASKDRLYIFLHDNTLDVSRGVTFLKKFNDVLSPGYLSNVRLTVDEYNWDLVPWKILTRTILSGLQVLQFDLSLSFQNISKLPKDQESSIWMSLEHHIQAVLRNMGPYDTIIFLDIGAPRQYGVHEPDRVQHFDRLFAPRLGWRGWKYWRNGTFVLSRSPKITCYYHRR